MNRFLVTGAGGFIGSHLARDLYLRGDFVRLVDIKGDGYIKEPYYSEKLTLDLRSLENCLTSTKDIDYVYTLAANMGGIGFITSVGAEVMYDNVLINANMLQASVQNMIKCLFYSSSACAYPTYRQTDADVAPLKQEDAYPADPDNFYGWEKLYPEKTYEAYKEDYGLDVRIVRYHNIYCPHHPDDNCRCHKPEPELVLQAARDFDIDPRIFIHGIGYLQMDIDLGKAVGCRTSLVGALPSENREGAMPDAIVPDLVGATRTILKWGDTPDNA